MLWGLVAEDGKSADYPPEAPRAGIANDMKGVKPLQITPLFYTQIRLAERWGWFKKVSMWDSP